MDRIDSLKAHHDWTFDLQKTGGVAGPNAKRGTAGATIHHEPAMGVGKVGRLRSHGKSQL